MASRGFSKHDGDWACPDPKCGNNNFARRDRCNRCGIERPRQGFSSGRVKMGGVELGKHLAEKSKGLFSADDWQCKSCGNVNWARRNTCNLCNTPKVGVLEERTGFGGGFMERDENPEKVERNSDDEEYDEFGRKKKKFRGKEPELQKKENTEEQEEEEDDEDDESDDEDLSKYAFDSDDAEGTKEDSKSNSKGASNKHSDSESSDSSKSSYSRSDSRSSRSRSHSNRDSRARSSSRSVSRSHSRSRSRSRSPIRS